MARFTSIFSSPIADNRFISLFAKGIMPICAFIRCCIRSVVVLTFVLGFGFLAGCQMETADADLPPVRLAPPAVEMAQAPAPRPMPAPAVPMPQPAAVHIAPHPAVPPSGVPAAWVPRVPANHWMWIIIHHSDSDYGSAAIIDKWHRDRGFDELGYHFVIGNGTNSCDGQIEVGPRWTKQKWGAHDNALDNRYNTNGIGICLVGNLNKYPPTPKQMHSLMRLVVYLMRTYNIPDDRVLGHGETKTTQCPGRYMNVAAIREQAARVLAQGDAAVESEIYADQR
jgi:hypothetical protein